MDALKAEQLGSNKWRVLAIPFGGPMTANRSGRAANALTFTLDITRD